MSPKATPLLPTMGVGSYAAPGWFLASWREVRKGGWGAGDVEELLDDATRIVLADQIEAGIDILSDGELRRQRFVYEMFDRLSGLERQAPRRRLGIAGYDMAPSFVAREPIAAPKGLGAVEEFLALKRLAPASAPLKVAIPGPLTFAMSIAPAPGVLETLIAIVNAELKALAAAGAAFVQLDEPGISRAPHGLSAKDGALAVNRALAGVEAQRAVHVCFGNNAGRPMADRRLGPLMDAMTALDCDVLMLEFANRQMADSELLATLAKDYIVAAGVIDVKNFRLETPADVAERLALCLKHAPAERLIATADCGFSALPRYLARQKLQALAAGAELARGH
ncbi:MAG: methionine synthase [Alphaproteobacteria bacterium]|nr:methionine synthase [Alphaproteobacteria bacterium]